MFFEKVTKNKLCHKKKLNTPEVSNLIPFMIV